LVREAAALGIKRILVTHPDDKVSAISEAQQRELIGHGAILEKCLITTMPGWGDLTIKQIAESIRNLGAENCVIVTDFGQAHHEIPTEGLKRFVKGLCESGITPEEIQVMLCKNPCRLLGIDH
jgi:predicted metal-dependent phosphotriesterase family hydrolase